MAFCDLFDSIINETLRFKKIIFNTREIVQLFFGKNTAVKPSLKSG